MKVFASHSSKVVDRPTSNRPEDRTQKILKKLSVHPRKICNANSNAEDLLRLAHSERYVEFLKNAYAQWSSDERRDKEFFYRDGVGLVPYHFYRSLRLSLDTSWRHIGYYATDAETPLYEHTWESCLIDASMVEEATNAFEKNRIPVYCIPTNPGHHAEGEHYGGYCFVNHAAIAANIFRYQYQYNRVAVLDLDYHHGNGCQDIFASRKDILTLSLHCDPRFDYPVFTGFVEENTKTNLNIPLPPGCDWDTYKEALNRALDAVVAFAPTVTILAFGGDTIRDDPNCAPGCCFSLEVEDYYRLGSAFRERKISPFIIQEGGYSDKIGDQVDSLLRGIGGF